jgi:hypothetical protein
MYFTKLKDCIYVTGSQLFGSLLHVLSSASFFKRSFSLFSASKRCLSSAFFLAASSSLRFRSSSNRLFFSSSSLCQKIKNGDIPLQ